MQNARNHHVPAMQRKSIGQMDARALSIGERTRVIWKGFRLGGASLLTLYYLLGIPHDWYDPLDDLLPLRLIPRDVPYVNFPISSTCRLGSVH